MYTLETKIEEITQIPKNYKAKVKKLGVKTLFDLLYYFPSRYEDFGQIIPIAKITPLQNNCIKGKIVKVEAQSNFFRKVNFTSALIEDSTGQVQVIWFGQPYLAKALFVGEEIILAGKVLADKRGGLYFSSPAYEKVENKILSDPDSLTHTGRIVPIYPQTTGLSSKWLRHILKPLLLEWRNNLIEPLPNNILKELNLMPLPEAIWQVHFPDTLIKANEAKKRFEKEQIITLQLSVLLEKIKMQSQQSLAMPIKLERLQHFISTLPFQLTDDQKKVIWKILKDMEKDQPMSRLLQGDVGSGKTVVAAICALNVIKNGYQVGFMAPTDLLARQHFKTLSYVFKGFDANVGLLTGKADELVSRKLKGQPIEVSRKKLLKDIEAGKVDIVVGTHALIKGKVKFKNLAFVVIDEQHRFGVDQRAQLAKRKHEDIKVPHLLSMSATPIPRSLALTIYGDLDVSVIKTMPTGRKEIITKVIHEEERQQTYDFIRQQVKEGRQVFVICPRIEKGENDDNSPSKNNWSEVKAVTEEYNRLKKDIFPDLNVAMLHGKMPANEKDKIMSEFKDKKSDILLSTSVVEVGVDVPNATVMMIEGAERFGLAQLHQFRGRVGRSDFQSYCFLFLGSSTGQAKARAKAMEKFSSGFDISKQDLKIRGPGEIFGTKQSGVPDALMDAMMDVASVEKTRDLAWQLLEKDPQLKKSPALLERIEFFKKNLHLE